MADSTKSIVTLDCLNDLAGPTSNLTIYGEPISEEMDEQVDVLAKVIGFEWRGNATKLTQQLVISVPSGCKPEKIAEEEFGFSSGTWKWSGIDPRQAVLRLLTAKVPISQALIEAQTRSVFLKLTPPTWDGNQLCVSLVWRVDIDEDPIHIHAGGSETKCLGINHNWFELFSFDIGIANVAFEFQYNHGARRADDGMPVIHPHPPSPISPGPIHPNPNPIHSHPFPPEIPYFPSPVHLIDSLCARIHISALAGLYNCYFPSTSGECVRFSSPFSAYAYNSSYGTGGAQTQIKPWSSEHCCGGNPSRPGEE